MFDVIATAKNTQWLSYPGLFSNYTYSHVENDAVDFQVIPGKNIFVGFNKKFGFELLRTVNHDGKDIIQRIKKRKLDDVSCGAITKTNGDEIALGMTTGFIRMFSVTSGEMAPHKFKPDRIGNSVVSLDYSNTGEYLAAVYDSTDIGLYGLKTGVRTNTFKLSGISTMVRFHPVRQFGLAVGSYEGAVTMMDIQTKKKLFFEKTAHQAPIRDISMYDSSQDVFVSCGLDCYINVFDLRKRLKVQQHKQPHPMSTVCVSPCGTFCVAGNFKGDVISYDFRSMKEPMETNRVFDSTVVRVAFIPSLGNAPDLQSELNENCSMLESPSPLYASARSQRTSSRDSFAKFVDVCHYNNVATADISTPKRRDSWADLMPTKKIHDFSMDSIADTPINRMSLANRSELRLKRTPRMSVDKSTIIEGVESDMTDTKVSVMTDVKYGNQCENQDPLDHIAMEKQPIFRKPKIQITSTPSEEAMSGLSIVAEADAVKPKCRDSWSDLMPTKKIHDFSIDSIAETPVNRMSRENRPEQRSINQVENRKPLVVQNSNNMALERKQHSTVPEMFGGRFQNTATSTVLAEDVQNSNNAFSTPTGPSGMNSGIGLGRKRRSTFHESFFNDIRNTNTSSPTKSSDGNVAGVSSASREVKATSASDLKLLGKVIDRSMDATRLRMSLALQETKKEMLSQTKELFEQAYKDVHEILEHYYKLGLQGGENLSNHLMKRMDDVEKLLFQLIQNDPFASEYFQLKFKVQALKEKLGIRTPDFVQHLK